MRAVRVHGSLGYLVIELEIFMLSNYSSLTGPVCLSLLRYSGIEIAAQTIEKRNFLELPPYYEEPPRSR